MVQIASVKPLKTKAKSHKSQKNVKHQKYFINSVKSLQSFTLAFCPKEKLITDLKAILQDLRSSKTKLTKLSHFTRQHVQFVKEVKMLNAIADDLTTGDDRNADFVEQIGAPHKEGIYLEEHFIRVFIYCFSLSTQYSFCLVI